MNNINWQDKDNLQYLNQMVTHLILIIAAIINLSCQLGHEEIWKTVLFLSVGYICNKPKPKVNRKEPNSEEESH